MDAVAEDPGAEPEVPSLVSLCLAVIGSNVAKYGERLDVLPLELAERLFSSCLPARVSLDILQTFARSFWKPTSVSLVGFQPGITPLGMQQLSLFADRLLRVDLTDCWWLQDLSFLQGLPQLECLKLSRCRSLIRETLPWIGGLSRLQCLDLESVCITDGDNAIQYLTRLTSLRALNLSCTGAGDKALDALTYGLRLKLWQTSSSRGEGSTSHAKRPSLPSSEDLCISHVADAADSSNGVSDGETTWPLSQLRFIRMRETFITDASVDYLMALGDLVLLDASGTRLTGRSLGPVRAKFGLCSLPNDSRMLFRTNTLVISTMQGSCGCTSMASSSGRHIPQAGASSSSSSSAAGAGECVVDALAEWEKKGVERLLRQASEGLGNVQLPPELEEERQRLEAMERDARQRFEQRQAERLRWEEQDRQLAGQLKWNMRHKLTSGLTSQQKRALEARQFHLERERHRLHYEEMRKENEWRERPCPVVQPSAALLHYLHEHKLNYYSLFDPSLRPTPQPQIPLVWPQGPLAQPHYSLFSHPGPYMGSPGQPPLFSPQGVQGLHPPTMVPVPPFMFPGPLAQSPGFLSSFPAQPTARPFRGRAPPPINQHAPHVALGGAGTSSQSVTGGSTTKAMILPPVGPQPAPMQPSWNMQQQAPPVMMPCGVVVSQPQHQPMYPLWAPPRWY